MMEEVSLASALGLHSEADAETACRLLQLHAGVLEGESRGSQEVGPTPYPVKRESYLKPKLYSHFN